MNNTELEKLTFEQALNELETIVATMESGNIPLDQMISYFERGNKLRQICSEKLSELEKKIEVLVREDDKGGSWTDFDPSNPRQVQPQVNAGAPVGHNGVAQQQAVQQQPVQQQTQHGQTTYPPEGEILF